MKRLGIETHVIEVVKKLLDPELEFDSIEVQRMKSAADLSIKMMAKFIPDLKSTLRSLAQMVVI